jgi:hypothetical protein
MGNFFIPKIDFPFKSYDKKLVFLQKNGQLLLLLGTKEKNFYFPIRESTFAKLFAHVLLVV